MGPDRAGPGAALEPTEDEYRRLLELRTGMFRPHGNDGPGVEVLAFGEEGRPLTIPGPLVRMAEGTIVAATIRNRRADSTPVPHGFPTRPRPSDATVQGRPDATRSPRVPGRPAARPGPTGRGRKEGTGDGNRGNMGQGWVEGGGENRRGLERELAGGG